MTATKTPRYGLGQGPFYIVRTPDLALLCHRGRQPPHWDRKFDYADNYESRNGVWSRVYVVSKQMVPFEYAIMTKPEILKAWAKQDTKAAKAQPEPEELRLEEPAVVRRPITKPEPEPEPAAFANSPLPPERAAIVHERQPEPPPDPVRNELVMEAMAREVSLMADEGAAYEMWQQARVKLRNHRKQRAFLEGK